MAKEDDKNSMTSAAPATTKAAPVVAVEPKPNLTRDGIELTMRARFIEQGKDEAEASKLAKKRALEMIPE